MSKSSSKLIIPCLYRHLISSKPLSNSPPIANLTGISQFLAHQPKIQTHNCTPWMFSAQRNYGLSSFPKILQNPGPELSPKSNLNLLGFRQFSKKGFNLEGNAYGKYVKSAVEKPVTVAKNVFSRYREAAGLQIEAFWKRNSLLFVGAGGLMVCIFLWRVMFGIANTFVGLSEGMAKYGFLALSAAIVAFSVSSPFSLLLISTVS